MRKVATLAEVLEVEDGDLPTTDKRKFLVSGKLLPTRNGSGETMEDAVEDYLIGILQYLNDKKHARIPR